MKNYRRPVPQKVREQIFEESNYLCAYCNYEPATEIEHIIPYAFRPDNSPENLVASCRRCNGLAGDLVFDDFDKKREFILKRREAKNVQKDILRDYAFCTNCQQSYDPRKPGTTMFLCRKCRNKPVKWLDD